MSDRKPRSGGMPADLDSLLTQVVAEAWAAGLSASDPEDAGWRQRDGAVVGGHRSLLGLGYARDATRRLLEGGTYERANEFAVGAAENRVNYVVGETGLKYEVTAAKGVPEEPALVAAGQQFVDAFSELNDLPQVERAAVWRTDRDGETFERLYPGDGIPLVRHVLPERVYPPPEDRRPADLLCDAGTIHPARDRGTVLGYYIDSGDGPEVVPEAEVVHLRWAEAHDWTRGWPVFFAARPALVRAEELMLAMTATGKARAKIALITSIPGWNAQKADQFVNRLTTRYAESPDGRRPQVESVEDLPNGSHLRLREGTEINFPPANLGSADVIGAIQANLRAASQPLVMPEWMFSGLADQKYSNAFVVEAPSLKMFRALQGRVVSLFGTGRMGCRASLVWRAMRMAAWGGHLNPAVLRAVQIKCTAPSLEARDKAAEASANVQYITAGVKPVALVQQELGYNPDELAKLRQKYPDPKAQAPPAPPAPDNPAPATPPGPVGESRVLVRKRDGEWVWEEHGPPPFPGAVFDEASHRWHNPHTGQSAPAAGGGPGGATGPHAFPADAELAAAPGKDLKPGGEVKAVEVGGKKYIVKQAARTAQLGPVEVLSADLAQIAGVNMPPAAMTTVGGKPALVQGYAPGRPIAGLQKESPDAARAAMAKVPPEQIDKNVMFDYLMGHSDVHNGNYMVSDDGHLTAIDKEMVLGRGNLTGQRFELPRFLDLTRPDGNGLAHKFDPKTVAAMAAAGDKMAAELDRRGMPKGARQVRDRAVVLKKLAAEPNTTAGVLSRLGSGGVTPPGLGLFGKLKWHLTKG